MKMSEWSVDSFLDTESF